mgnify:CR=1 FL=1
MSDDTITNREKINNQHRKKLKIIQTKKKGKKKKLVVCSQR